MFIYLFRLNPIIISRGLEMKINKFDIPFWAKACISLLILLFACSLLFKGSGSGQQSAEGRDMTLVEGTPFESMPEDFLDFVSSIVDEFGVGSYDYFRYVNGDKEVVLAAFPYWNYSGLSDLKRTIEGVLVKSKGKEGFYSMYNPKENNVLLVAVSQADDNRFVFHYALLAGGKIKVLGSESEIPKSCFDEDVILFRGILLTQEIEGKPDKAEELKAEFRRRFPTSELVNALDKI